MVEDNEDAEHSRHEDVDAEIEWPEFGKLVTRLMRENHLTDETVGSAIGRSRAAVALYRAGKRMPNNKETLQKLASLLGVSASELFGADHPDQIPRTLIDGDVQQLSPDELDLLRPYRSLPEFGKKLVRQRAVQLQEQFGKKGKNSPYSPDN